MTGKAGLKSFKMMGSPANAEPGLVRLDGRRNLSGCGIVWENDEVRAGAKLSLDNGLIDVHERLMGTEDQWYITAPDFKTGEMVWRHHLGSGTDWDNALLTLSISPNGVLTSGMFAGILAAKDAP